MYAYCQNNPVMMVDSNGYMPTWMKIAFVAIAVVAVVAAAVILAPAVVAAASTLVVSGSGALALGAAGGAITAGGVATALAYTAIAATSIGVLAYDEARSDDESSSHDYTVYTLIDPKTGDIEYVGRVKTANYKARMAYHEKTKGLVPGEKVSGLTYLQCRGLEQAGMMYHLTRESDGQGGYNKVNGISLLNPRYSSYMNSGLYAYMKNQAENEWLNLFG